MAKEKFYMCYVEGGNSPTYKHFTLEGATTEAGGHLHQDN